MRGRMMRLARGYAGGIQSLIEPHEDRKPWRGVVGAVVAVAIWAGWISATRFAVTDRVDPLVLAICRTGLPALILFPVILRRGLVPAGASVLAIALMAAGWGAPFVFMVGTGLKTVPAGLFGPLVPGLAPILVAIMAWALLGERPGGRLVAGLVLIGGAMSAILGQWVLRGDTAALHGAPFLIAASFGLSLYTVMFRNSGLNPLEATAYISLYSLPVLAIWLAIDPVAVTGLSVAQWAFHAFVQGMLTGIGAVLAYGIAVRHLGAVRGSTANALVPVCAALVGMFVLGEILTALDWIAVVAASLGVAVINGAFARRRRRVGP